MESFLTQEQEEKLSALRFEADKELTSIVGKIKNRKLPKPETIKQYAVGDKVKVNNSVSGTITAIIRENYYEVTTTTKKVLSISYRYIKSRIDEDYSSVKIPDELKSMSNNKLIYLLKNYRKAPNKYHIIQIKAELSTRGHIKRKAELKKDKEQKTIDRLKRIVKSHKKAGKKNTKQIRYLKKKLE